MLTKTHCPSCARIASHETQLTKSHAYPFLGATNLTELRRRNPLIPLDCGWVEGMSTNAALPSARVASFLPSFLRRGSGVARVESGPTQPAHPRHLPLSLEAILVSLFTSPCPRPCLLAPPPLLPSSRSWVHLTFKYASSMLVQWMQLERQK